MYHFAFKAAIPPTRARSSSTNRPTGTQIYRTSSSKSASLSLDGLSDMDAYSTKPLEPRYLVYHWGGGITTPTKLQLPQHDSDVVQVASGRTMKTGVTGGGRAIIWDSNKKAMDVSSDVTADREKLLEDLWVPKFLEGQSGVTIVQVSCGDTFAACLTGALCIIITLLSIMNASTYFPIKTPSFGLLQKMYILMKMFLGNCPPTRPLSQHFVQSEKSIYKC